ncbi:unnamed protein product [Adineta ricciae]|uniref:Uncharacterized protein n=1 Tax=Adineta ricciae TaxID=249248 RepID=A0A814SCS7_ADIRI|nr:unnamed protein product [Adineta ricciae]CAF1146313.1 unnamed protein product [Adineta ricciae]
MSDLDTLRSLLYSRSIDSNNVKPYTGFHYNAAGDLVLSTPSLDSYRVNKDPMYPFEGGRPQHPPNELDQRVLNYNTLEMRRYQFLRMKQPASRYVSRIFEERFGSASSPRAEPKRTIRIAKAPGYRLLLDRIANQDQTMVSQRFNKIAPFVTEHGTNVNADPVLRQMMA